MSNDYQDKLNTVVSEILMSHEEGNVKAIVAIYIDKDGRIRRSLCLDNSHNPYLIMGLELSKISLLSVASGEEQQLVRNKQ